MFRFHFQEASLNTQTLRLHPNDNVAVALKSISAGTILDGYSLNTRDPIPAGHKVALRRIDISKPILKYNQIIGFADSTILPAQHVHTHNVSLHHFSRDYEFCVDLKPLAPVSEPATFEGYVRENGRVGTRNYIGILTSVNCSASVARFIAKECAENAPVTASAIDGVAAFTHGTGCSMNIHGEGLQLLRRTMTGYATHPNLAGVLVVGLGCEVNQIPEWLEEAGLSPGPLLKILVIQENGGTRNTVTQGIRMIREISESAKTMKRETIPVSHLTLGLECGGSDAYWAASMS